MLTKKEVEPEMLGMKRRLIERPTEGCPHCRLGPVKKKTCNSEKKAGNCALWHIVFARPW